MSSDPQKQSLSKPGSPLRWARGRLLVIACSALVLAVSAILSRFPSQVEQYYCDGMGAALSRSLGLLTAITDQSLAEWMVAGVLMWLAAMGALGWRRLRQRRQTWRRTLLSGLLHLGALSAAAAALFYFLWGLNYSRPPLIERMGWQQWDRVPPSDEAWHELERVGTRLVELSNQAYRRAHGGVEWRPNWSHLGRQEIDAQLEEAYSRLAAKLDLPRRWSLPHGPAKPLRASLLTSYLGISGIYFPWTGEANFNHMVPQYQLPHIIAHEKAHQRGIAGEDEANFFGFLACLESRHPYVRYSGLVFAQRQLINEIYRRNPHLARRLVSQRLPAVRRDIEEAGRFWRQFEGPASKVGEAVNDSYLRLHGVREGIASYSLSTRLILVYLRQNGGRL
ncbi:MAG TPA: DUF3810 domain-containing protein [Acidobacteriota bacterium]|nr:DUF3810 domain-containing protein [Acidobacteriota bacterium]